MTKKNEVSACQRPASLIDNATLWSRLTYNWPYATLKTGLAKTLEPVDLPKLSQVDSSRYLTNQFEAGWKAQLAKKVSDPSYKPSLAKVFLWDYWKFSYILQPLLVGEEVLRVAQCVLLGKLVSHFTDYSAAVANGTPLPQEEGFIIGITLVSCAFVALLLHHVYYFLTWRKGSQLKQGSIGLIFRKVLKLSFGATNEASSGGKVINLATNDVERYMLASIFLPYLFYGPLEAVVVLFVGVKYVGKSFLAGWCVLIFFVPFQYWLSKKFATVRSKVATITDKRVSLIGQAVAGCRVMKMSGWEEKFHEKIQEIRALEVEQIQRANRLKSANEGIFFVVNVFIIMVIFTTHVLYFEEELSPTIVFTALTLMNILQFVLTKFFSLGIMGASEVAVSVNRIQAFLEYDDADIEGEGEGEGKAEGDSKSEFAVEFTNYSARWSKKNDGALALNNLGVKFAKNKIHAIIGPVGSGKSAFLYAILKELIPSSGTISVNGTIGYASQQPFIMSGSLKDNITMGVEVSERLPQGSPHTKKLTKPFFSAQHKNSEVEQFYLRV